MTDQGSRYKENDIKNLAKADLVNIITCHPEVVWPSKVCKWRDPNLIAVKHLKKAILGAYGYTKVFQQDLQTAVQAEESSADIVAVVIQVNGFKPSDGEKPSKNPQDNERNSETLDLALENGTTGGNVELTVSNMNQSKIPGGDVSEEGQMAAPIVADSEYLALDDSQIEMALDRVQVGVDGSTMKWRFEKDLHRLKAFIQNDSKLQQLYNVVKARKNRRQSDADVFELYRCGSELFQSLRSNRSWDEYSGDMPSLHIQLFLDLTPAWLSNAKKVCVIMQELGPASRYPDELVIKRLEDEKAFGKGERLLPFLKRRLALRETDDLGSNSERPFL
ncbi:hypothetical protein BDZ97DRAFT_1759833 [Flammula alnicola]|nr:hypothetical protein BDZ97DRAFT_1759833 [Flammula alnicola]